MRTSARIAAAILASGCIVEAGVGHNVDEPEPEVPEPIDRDGDGFSAVEDCDDYDAAIAPGEREACDGKDNDCDQKADIDPVSGVHVCESRDDFRQKLRLDVLFVFDVSQSMTPYHQRAAEGAVAFLREVVGPAHETHIGVLTMNMEDPTQRGRLVESTTPHGTSLWIDGESTTVDAATYWMSAAILESQVQLAGEEGGRAVLERAISVEADGANAGFFRADADLVVVFASNEVDKSGFPSTPELLDVLETFKGSLSQVTIHSIAQLDDFDCEGVYSPVTRGVSYLDLAAQTSGTTLSVCEHDYQQYLATVGQISADQGLEDRFRLALPAQDPMSTIVKIVLPNTGTARILDYDEGEYALIDGNSTLLLLLDPLPPPGTQILVDYLQAY